MQNDEQIVDTEDTCDEQTPTKLGASVVVRDGFVEVAICGEDGFFLEKVCDPCVTDDEKVLGFLPFGHTDYAKVLVPKDANQPSSFEKFVVHPAVPESHYTAFDSYERVLFDEKQSMALVALLSFWLPVLLKRDDQKPTNLDINLYYGLAALRGNAEENVVQKTETELKTRLNQVLELLSLILKGKGLDYRFSPVFGYVETAATYELISSEKQADREISVMGGIFVDMGYAQTKAMPISKDGALKAMPILLDGLAYKDILQSVKEIACQKLNKPVNFSQASLKDIFKKGGIGEAGSARFVSLADEINSFCTGYRDRLIDSLSYYENEEVYMGSVYLSGNNAFITELDNTNSALEFKHHDRTAAGALLLAAKANGAFK
ncbi:hypothetical protein ACFBZI_11520 [Moraxella sp. ZJ142]|uniref:hypothetical protein n=1 Tax=Moraxella marmotae TaxID=3344520 RepID=UPI0035D4DC4F